MKHARAPFSRRFHFAETARYTLQTSDEMVDRAISEGEALMRIVMVVCS